MKVLIACEFSGIVREAFIKQGHDAWSCDLLPSEIPGQHIQGNVLEILKRWDLVIAHPPCTHLAVSGARWFNDKQKEQNQAIDFFMSLVNAPIEKICIENPVGIMSTHYRKPDQYVQPWQFGHDASKKTGLWLKNLQPLTPTRIIIKDRYANQTPSGQNKLGPSDTKWKERSRTYQGIADAMAEQWGVSFNSSKCVKEVK